MERKVNFTKEQILNIKNELDNFFNSDCKVTDFNDYPIEGVEIDCISLIGNFNCNDSIGDFIYILDIEDEQASVKLTLPAFPITLDDLLLINFINQINKDVKVYYFENYLNVDLGTISVSSDQVAKEAIAKIVEAVNNKLIYDFMNSKSKRYICPKCGEVLEYETTIERDSGVYHCYNCDYVQTVEETTGLDKYIEA